MAVGQSLGRWRGRREKAATRAGEKLGGEGQANVDATAVRRCLHREALGRCKIEVDVVVCSVGIALRLPLFSLGA